MRSTTTTTTEKLSTFRTDFADCALIWLRSLLAPIIRASTLHTRGVDIIKVDRFLFAIIVIRRLFVVVAVVGGGR